MNFPCAVDHEHGLLAVHHADQFDAAGQHDENAMLGIALIEDDFTGREVLLLAQRHQPRNLRLIQFWKHPFGEFGSACHASR